MPLLDYLQLHNSILLRAGYYRPQTRQLMLTLSTDLTFTVFTARCYVERGFIRVGCLDVSPSVGL